MAALAGGSNVLLLPLRASGTCSRGWHMTTCQQIQQHDVVRLRGGGPLSAAHAKARLESAGESALMYMSRVLHPRRELKAVLSSSLEGCLVRVTRPDTYPVDEALLQRVLVTARKLGDPKTFNGAAPHTVLASKLLKKVFERDWRTCAKGLHVLHRLLSDADAVTHAYADYVIHRAGAMDAVREGIVALAASACFRQSPGAGARALLSTGPNIALCDNIRTSSLPHLNFNLNCRGHTASRRQAQQVLSGMNAVLNKGLSTCFATGVMGATTPLQRQCRDLALADARALLALFAAAPPPPLSPPPPRAAASSSSSSSAQELGAEGELCAQLAAAVAAACGDACAVPSWVSELAAEGAAAAAEAATAAAAAAAAEENGGWTASVGGEGATAGEAGGGRGGGEEGTAAPLPAQMGVCVAELGGGAQEGGAVAAAEVAAVTIEGGSRRAAGPLEYASMRGETEGAARRAEEHDSAAAAEGDCTGAGGALSDAREVGGGGDMHAIAGVSEADGRGARGAMQEGSGAIDAGARPNQAAAAAAANDAFEAQVPVHGTAAEEVAGGGTAQTEAAAEAEARAQSEGAAAVTDGTT
ncbi:hypothetical protein JKP88DRAFT_261542 [Tribonema minus]|uniref:ENTH domain-containing protein n=1 Tax=Tribonema minus TaxID=303371 RepID=A0A835YL55_9STRA|nr:hypothetical protein JKP88DRAFT_261542 [Tribonema minus]